MLLLMSYLLLFLKFMCGNYSAGGLTKSLPLTAPTINETRRKRGVSPWPYLADVIRQRRKGLPAPALPQPAI